MKEFSRTEAKILSTALEMVSETGSFDITIRDLAKRAGVNVASINYHFGTKDKMLELVKDYYISNTKKAYSPIFNEDLDDGEKLSSFAREILDYTLKYPGVVNILKEVCDCQDSLEGKDREILEITREMNDALDSILYRKFYDGDDLCYQFKKNIFLSSLIYPATHMKVLELDSSTVLEEDKKKRYIDYTLNLLC